MRACSSVLLAAAFALAACPSPPDPRVDAAADPPAQGQGSGPTAGKSASDAEGSNEDPRQPVRRRITRAGALKMPARVEPMPGQSVQLRLSGLNDLASWTRSDPKLARALQRTQSIVSQAVPSEHLAKDARARAVLAELDLRAPLTCDLLQGPIPQTAAGLVPVQRCSFALRSDQSTVRIWPTEFQHELSQDSDGRWVNWRGGWAWLSAQPAGARAYTLTTFLANPGLNPASPPSQAPQRDQRSRRSPDGPTRFDPGLELRLFGAPGLASLRAQLRQALGSQDAFSPATPGSLLARIGPQIDQLIARATLVGPRPTLELALRWREGSAIDSATLASTTHALPTGLLRDVPPNSVAFVFVGIDLEHWLLQFTNGPRPSPLTEGAAAVLGMDAQQVHESVNAYAQHAQKTYAPTLGVVVDRRASGGPSLTVLRKLRGESARPQWLAWARNRAGAHAESFELQEAVQRLDGHLVDRLRIRLPPLVSARSRQLGPAFAWLSEAIVIERVEAADYVVWGIDAQARPDLNRRWVEWLTRPFNKRTWHHLGSFARHPADMALIGGLNLSLLSRSLGGRMLVSSGSLDDLRVLASPLAPSDLVMRVQGSLELVHYLGDESAPVAFVPPAEI